MIIKDRTLKKGQYHDEVQPKRIIVLHHTAGGSAQSSIDWWNSTKERVGTSVIIDRNGDILKAFPYDNWASALGIKQSTFDIYKLKNINVRLDQISIQIEIASWGGLTEKNGKFYTYTNSEVPKENVQVYDTPYRGYKYYEKYTEAQLKALEELLKELCNKYPQIKKDYNTDMWGVSKRALEGTWGIWTHTSYRSDKNDCHPQPELIQILKNIK